jgi:hypothetical protein
MPSLKLIRLNICYRKLSRVNVFLFALYYFCKYFTVSCQRRFSYISFLRDKIHRQTPWRDWVRTHKILSSSRSGEHQSLMISRMSRTCLGRVPFRRMKIYGKSLILKHFPSLINHWRGLILISEYPIRVSAWTPVILTGFLRSLCRECRNGIPLNSCPILSNLSNDDYHPLLVQHTQRCWVTISLPDIRVEKDEKLTRFWIPR